MKQLEELQAIRARYFGPAGAGRLSYAQSWAVYCALDLAIALYLGVGPEGLAECETQLRDSITTLAKEADHMTYLDWTDFEQARHTQNEIARNTPPTVRGDGTLVYQPGVADGAHLGRIPEPRRQPQTVDGGGDNQ